MSTTTYAPDALANLRDSFALHLDATRAPKTTRIYLDALDSLVRHLDANGMPIARAVLQAGGRRGRDRAVLDVMES
jgi:hypothetical protein